MDSNVSANVGDTGSIPIPGRCHRATKPMPNNCCDGALEPGILNYWSLQSLTTEARMLELVFWNKKPLRWEVWALQTHLHAVQPQVERAGSQQRRPSINKPNKLWKGNRMLTNLLNQTYIWFTFNVPKMPKYRRREWLLTPVFLPGESHGQKSLAGYSPWSRMESDMTEPTEHQPPRIAE